MTRDEQSLGYEKKRVVLFDPRPWAIARWCLFGIVVIGTGLFVAGLMIPEVGMRWILPGMVVAFVGYVMVIVLVVAKGVHQANVMRRAAEEKLGDGGEENLE